MLVTLAWVGLWIGLIIEAIFLIYLAWDFLSYINKIEPKKKIEEKILEEEKSPDDLSVIDCKPHNLSAIERRRKRQDRISEIMKRSNDSLTPHVELVLKENGWIKGEDNLWSNKDYTNISFNEAVEEDSLSMLDDIITRRERAYKLHNLEKLKTILVKEENNE